jgi:hypothetical protein
MVQQGQVLQLASRNGEARWAYRYKRGRPWFRLSSSRAARDVVRRRLKTRVFFKELRTTPAPR